MACATAVVLAAAGCGGNPSSPGDLGRDQGINQQSQTMDASAVGPAPEVPGAVKGGTLTVYSQSTVSTLDPTEIYFTDSNEIAKLVFRTPTQFAVRNGKPVLVPDLTDLGTASADGLTWTFKMRGDFKYADGSAVKVEDLAYAIKR